MRLKWYIDSISRQIRGANKAINQRRYGDSVRKGDILKQVFFVSSALQKLRCFLSILGCRFLDPALLSGNFWAGIWPSQIIEVRKLCQQGKFLPLLLIRSQRMLLLVGKFFEPAYTTFINLLDQNLEICLFKKTHKLVYIHHLCAFIWKLFWTTHFLYVFVWWHCALKSSDKKVWVVLSAHSEIFLFKFSV